MFVQPHSPLWRASVVDAARYGIEREIAFVSLIVQAFGSVPVVHSFGTQSSSAAQKISPQSKHSNQIRRQHCRTLRRAEGLRDVSAV